jgi:c-di-GMP-binding flagellar brake protein YcgR
MYVRFHSVVEEIVEAAPAYYRISFPDSIDYEQRREYFRAPVPIDSEVPIRLQADDRTTLSGEVRDISLGGVSARLDPGSSRQIRVGETLPTYMIDLLGAGQIVLPLRFASPMAPQSSNDPGSVGGSSASMNAG